ncbi:MAG: twin-arginine translocase TatA/TatE family subunit [Flavobacteriales bacterium]|nr:MAG: twin-arginine translocase TatA/TatE family subunit [Flavobacteriales bacterium]
MFVIGVAIVLLFGPDKLPKIARDLGTGVRKMKGAMNDLKDEVLQDADNPVAEIKKEIDGVKKSIQDFNPKEHLDLEKTLEEKKNEDEKPTVNQLEDDYQGPVSR